MRLFVSVFILGWMFLRPASFLNAQISQPLIPLELQGDPQATQIPSYASLGTPQCDSSGQIFVRYNEATDPSQPATLAAIESDGSTQTVSLASAASKPADNHVFLLAAGNDGSLHEIVRVPTTTDQSTPATEVQYATFDSDGSLRSRSEFGDQFIPSLLLPLPSGNFFAAGVNLRDDHGEISESPLAGIFSSDAVLLSKLKKDPAALEPSKSTDPNEQEVEADFSAGIAKLGGDGNIYVLLPGDKAKIAVVTQAGRIVREFTLQEPFETDVAHDIWISGNRILVVYEGETDDPRDAYVYVLYDTQSGNVVRVYHPQFSGTVACFQDGQTLSVLLQQPSSGKITLGSAELQ